MNGSAAFSPEGYRALIRSIGERGYTIRDFSSAEPRARHLVLRHDVDFSLDAAATMADP